MSSNSILENYKQEHAYALNLKENGQIFVCGKMAGETLAAGRTEIPIDEYIAHWANGIAAMEAGADPALFNY